MGVEEKGGVCGGRVFLAGLLVLVVAVAHTEGKHRNRHGVTVRDGYGLG